MKKQLLNASLVVLLLSVAFTACKKSEDNPAPDEQELITTIKLTLTNSTNAADVKTYTYKVENGFNSTSPGIVIADTLKLQAGVAYNSSIIVLNEKANPVEDITSEIVSEKDEHLFLLTSVPATGAGAVAFSNGATDNAGKPFNITGVVTAGTTGSGHLNLYLLHQPTDKSGTTLAAAGGETDVAAVYPVRIN